MVWIWGKTKQRDRDRESTHRLCSQLEVSSAQAQSVSTVGWGHPEWRQKDPQAWSSSGWPAGCLPLESACYSND